MQARDVNLEDELTVLIDTKKYLEIFTRLNEADNCAENEVFQECGSMCILGCRNASSSIGIMLSNDECEKTECVKGCFCNDGLVRHRDKCIAVTECSDRSGKEVQFTTEISDNTGPMKIFGLLRPQGCGIRGCSVPVCGPSGCGTQTCGPHGCGIHIHNYNEAINGKKKRSFLRKCQIPRID